MRVHDEDGADVATVIASLIARRRLAIGNLRAPVAQRPGR